MIKVSEKTESENSASSEEIFDEKRNNDSQSHQSDYENNNAPVAEIDLFEFDKHQKH